MERFSVQRYVWDAGQMELGVVERAYAEGPLAAAQAALGHRLLDRGPIDRLAVKVWPYGKAKRMEDVLRFWSP